MASAKERMQVLKMIEEGKISAQEGAELLRALGKSAGQNDPPGQSVSDPRWFRVRITDLDSGRQKANVNIPVSLVNVSLKMGARFAPEMAETDWAKLMEALRSGQQGKVMDVTDDESGERVEIFVE